MANWVIQVSQNWLKPVYELLKETLLASHVIHADETVIQVLKEDGKKASSESRMWVYATSERSARQVRYFEYQPDRKWLRAAQFLEGFHGCLVTDGYAGYPGSGCRSLWMLGAHATEVARRHAEGRDDGNQ